MNVLCQSDRPVPVGGRVRIFWMDSVSLPLGVYLLGENNNNPWRESRWMCERAWEMALGTGEPGGLRIVGGEL